MTSKQAPSINGNSAEPVPSAVETLETAVDDDDEVQVVVRPDGLSSLPDSPPAAGPEDDKEAEPKRAENNVKNGESKAVTPSTSPNDDNVAQQGEGHEVVPPPRSRPFPGDCDEIPLIALLNRKSGGGKGVRAFDELGALPHSHVMDILEFAKDAAAADAKLRELIDANPHCRVIVGGGDGTVTWAFEILHRIGRSPPVATLPLGTANEVSGCIGWSNSDNGKRLHKFAHKVRRGEITDVDLWKVEYSDDNDGEEKEPFSGRRPNTMVAFLSFGLDAAIAHKFHEHRERMTERPSSTLHSKMIYLRYGADEIRHPSPKLNDRIDIKVDGGGLKRKPARSYRCLQVLNINSMADGVDFFGTSKSAKDDVLQEGDYTPPKLNDGKLEVVGLTTVHAMNFMRANIGHALRLGQGKSLEFTLKQPTPMEVDGEAWINPKGVIRVTHWGAPDIVIGPKRNGSTRRGIIRKNPSSAVNAKISL